MTNLNIIYQYFIQPNFRFIKIANLSYCKVAKVFFTKTLQEVINLSKFQPTRIVQHMVCDREWFIYANIWWVHMFELTANTGQLSS